MPAGTSRLTNAFACVIRLADRAAHQPRGQFDVKVTVYRPDESVREDHGGEPLRVAAGGAEPDRAAPVVHHQRDVAQVEHQSALRLALISLPRFASPSRSLPRAPPPGLAAPRPPPARGTSMPGSAGRMA